MGGAGVEAGIDILNRADVPNFPYPDLAAMMFQYMWRYSYNLRGLYETPLVAGAGDDEAAEMARARQLVQEVRRAGRTLLTEYESKQLLAAYRIPTVETRLALTEAEAVKQAGQLGYPVVLKLHSETITHKTEVGGVQLNLGDADAVCHAYRTIAASVGDRVGPQHFQGVTVQRMIKLGGYELIVGSSIDPQFGPVLLFGTGGQLVEVFKDRALALPPLNTTLALRMMEQTRIFTALKGVRGRRPIDLVALEQLLVRFSRLVVEQRWIREIDINPLLAAPDQLVALDARVVLFGPDVAEDQLPRPAIQPYPTQYIQTWQLHEGTTVTIRPIRPEDEPLLVKFHQTLSEHSVYFRYLQALKLSQRVTHERLARLCFIDYDREMALVALQKDAENGTADLVAVARLIKLHGRDEAEFALIVSDRCQGQGLGTELLRRLLEIARDQKIRRVTADILAENNVMQEVCEALGFRLQQPVADRVVKAAIELP
jgi:acetyltransferase